MIATCRSSIPIRLATAGALLLAVQACSSGQAAPTLAKDKPPARDAYCSQTADAVADACEAAAVEALLIAQANCTNLVDDGARAACQDDADAAQEEELEACEEQEAARLEACALLGESRYDPAVDPANFVDPLQVGEAVAPNPYLPLVPGYTRVYEKGDEKITVTVTHDTVEIMGVTCIVVRDIAEENGELVEDTDDWFAQDLAGNVWYFGEFVRNFEDGVLHDLDGSFKAGEEGAKPGIAMKAAPQPSEAYRQEWFLGEAEDIAEVLGTAASESAPAASCDDTCLQTRDFSPLEPDTSEHKFYVPGIGEIVAYHVDEPDEREELVEYFFE